MIENLRPFKNLLKTKYLSYKFASEKILKFKDLLTEFLKKIILTFCSKYNEKSNCSQLLFKKNSQVQWWNSLKTLIPPLLYNQSRINTDAQNYQTGYVNGLKKLLY